MLYIKKFLIDSEENNQFIGVKFGVVFKYAKALGIVQLKIIHATRGCNHQYNSHQIDTHLDSQQSHRLQIL